MLVLPGVLNQRGGEGGVVRNEPAVIPTLPKERSQGLDSAGDRPVLNDGGVFRRNADTLSADLMSQVLDMILEQLGFLWGDLKSSRIEGCQYLPEDPQMAPRIRGVNGGVIQVAEDFRQRGGDGGPWQPAENK